MDNRANEKLGAFVSSLMLSTDYEKAFKQVNEFVCSLGFDGLLYTYIPKVDISPGMGTQPIYSVSDGYSPAFIKHYMDARFDRQDAMINAVRNGATSTLHWWEEVRQGAVSKEEKIVLDTARFDYGITNGITIPLFAGHHGISGASMICSDSDRLFELKMKENQRLVEVALKVFHQKVMLESWKTDVFVRPVLGTLNQNERTVLNGLIGGYSAKIIAARSGIGVKNVERILRQIKIRFGGKNTTGNPNISTAELAHYVGKIFLDQSI